MNLEYILKLCKKNRQIMLLSYGGYKFLTEGHVAVMVQGICPKWTVDDYFTAIGGDKEVKDIFTLTDNTENPQPVIDVDELKELQPLKYSLTSGKQTYKMFVMADGKIMIIQEKYLDVFRDEFAPEYYYRDNPLEPNVYVVVSGICVGIIMAMYFDMQQLADFGGTLSEGFKRNLKDGFLDMGGQIEITD